MIVNKVRYSKNATQPNYYPVSLDECKNALEIYDSIHDSKIKIMLGAAVAEAESYTGACFAQRTVNLYYDSIETFYRLPVYPVRSIDSIEYLSDSVYTAFTDFESDLDDTPPLVYFKSYPPADDSLKTIKMVLSVGYSSNNSPADAGLIPDDIKQAIIFHVYQSFLTRGELSDQALKTFRNILYNYRVLGI